MKNEGREWKGERREQRKQHNTRNQRQKEETMLCVTVAAASGDFHVIMVFKERLEMNMWQAFLQGHAFTTMKVCV